MSDGRPRTLPSGTVVAPDIVRTHNLGAFLQTANVASANNCWFLRCMGTGTISKVAIRVGVASGNISVAVYRNSGTGRDAVPGERLATSGAVACPASGYREVSLGASVAVSAGDWLALSADNTTATFVIGGDGGGLGTVNLFQGLLARQDTAHPAPSAPAGLVADASRPLVLVGVA